MSSATTQNINVLHVAAGEIGVGAVKAAYELHRSLLTSGINSRILMLGKESKEGVLQCDWYHKEKEKEVEIIKRHPDRKAGFICTGTKAIIPNSFGPYLAWADIIHIHFIGLGFSNLSDLAELPKPKLITLRDMWFFTGVCNYSDNCKKFENECGACHLLGSDKKSDWSTFSHQLKKKLLSTPDYHFHFSAISKWIRDTAKASSVLSNNEIKLINNGVDTDLFNIAPKRSNNILFIAANIENTRKGFDLFVEAIKKVSLPNLSLTIVGRNSRAALTCFPANIEVGTYDFLDDDRALSKIYAHARVVAFASREEVFGKTITEAMACGTPTVAFDVGGPSEIIVHQETGVLVTPYNTDEYAKGIEWVLNQDEHEIASKCRSRALQVFDQRKITKHYQEAYSKILKSFDSRKV